MKHLYAVLLITNDQGRNRMVVCETIADYKDVTRSARNAFHNVNTIACCEGDFKRFLITLNDYSFHDTE